MIIKFDNGKGSIVGTEDGVIRIMHPDNPVTVEIRSDEAKNEIMKFYLEYYQGDFIPWYED